MPDPDGGWILPSPIDPGTRRILAICVPDSPEWRRAVAGALQEVSYWWNWQRDSAHSGVQAGVLWQQILETALERFDMGEQFCFTCDELNACLQPLYTQITALQAQVTALQGSVTNIDNDMTNLQNDVDALQTQTNQATTVQQPEPVQSDCLEDGNIYAGTIQVVEYINDFIIDLFEQGEASTADNGQELLSNIIDIFPFMEALPADGLFALTQWMFQNQQATYEGAYTIAWRDEAACLLWCRIKDNNCLLDTDLLVAWLNSLIDDIPGNAASEVYSRFGAVSGDGLLAQVSQVINTIKGGESISKWYDRVLVEYENGYQDTNNGYTLCECPPDLTPIGIATTDCQGGTFSAAAGVTYVSDDMWDIDISIPVPGGYGAHIKDDADGVFAYEVVSGVANATVCLNYQGGAPGVCHYSGNGGGFIDQNQALKELSIYRTNAQGVGVVRIHFKVP